MLNLRMWHKELKDFYKIVNIELNLDDSVSKVIFIKDLRDGDFIFDEVSGDDCIIDTGTGELDSVDIQLFENDKVFDDAFELEGVVLFNEGSFIIQYYDMVADLNNVNVSKDITVIGHKHV